MYLGMYLLKYVCTCQLVVPGFNTGCMWAILAPVGPAAGAAHRIYVHVVNISFDIS